jgi:hypothetical protein
METPRFSGGEPPRLLRFSAIAAESVRRLRHHGNPLELLDVSYTTEQRGYGREERRFYQVMEKPALPGSSGVTLLPAA